MVAILLGYSVDIYENQKVFIKHFGYTDNLETDYQYRIAYDEAMRRGIWTKEKKLEELKKEGSWTEKEDETLASLYSALGHLKKQRSKLYLPSQVAIKNEQIKETEVKLSKLQFKKDQLLYSTAEKKAERRAEDYFVYSSFFLDSKFERPFFHESFDDIDSDTLLQLKNVYFRSMETILGGGTKRIALSRDFIDLMYTAEHPYEILGKPYAFYTTFQLDLINFGRFFKHILSSDPPPPQSAKEDPDKLEEWWETSQNAKKVLQKRGKQDSGAGATNLIGATTEDLKQMYGEGEVVNLDTELKQTAKNKGKTVLGIEDLMKMRGI